MDTNSSSGSRKRKSLSDEDALMEDVHRSKVHAASQSDNDETWRAREQHLMQAAQGSVGTSVDDANSTVDASPNAMTPATEMKVLATANPCDDHDIVDEEEDEERIMKDDHLQSLFQNESKFFCYNPNARYLQYRRMIVSWMLEAGVDCRLTDITIHTAVKLLDRILGVTQVSKKFLQLVSLCCLLVAAKFEEKESRMPSISDLNKCSSNVFTPESVKDMEVKVLNALDWRLSVVTVQHFLEFAQEEGVLFHRDTIRSQKATQKNLSHVEGFIRMLSFLALEEYEFQRYLPSVVAAAVIAVARQMSQVEPVWNHALVNNTGYTLKEITPCFKDLTRVYRQRIFDSSPVTIDELDNRHVQAMAVPQPLTEAQA